MGAAFRIVNIIAKSQHIFVKLIHILEGALHGDSFRFALKVDDVADRLTALVDILDEADNALRLMVLDMLNFRSSLILVNNGKLGI